jgi:ribosomal protein S4
MPKYTVDEVLEIIQGLSTEELAILKAQLKRMSGAGEASTVQQTRTMTVGGNFQVGGKGVTVDMSQQQAVGSLAIPQEKSDVSSQEIAQEIAALHQQILTTSALNPVEKATAEVPLKTVAAELEKETPDKNLIDQSITALQKGVSGIETLADPVKRVAALIAKAWIVL